MPSAAAAHSQHTITNSLKLHCPATPQCSVQPRWLEVTLHKVNLSQLGQLCAQQVNDCPGNLVSSAGQLLAGAKTAAVLQVEVAISAAGPFPATQGQFHGSMAEPQVNSKGQQAGCMSVAASIALDHHHQECGVSQDERLQLTGLLLLLLWMVIVWFFRLWLIRLITFRCAREQHVGR